MTTSVADISLDTLRHMMLAHKVKQLLVKELASNDNSKNQVYLGGSLDILNLLPMGEVRQETTPAGRSGLKAPLSLAWVRDDGTLTDAPHSQLILYPQYPEIRFSGFLQGAHGGPNQLMTVRDQGRLLFFGIAADRRIICRVAASNSALAREVGALRNLERTGVFNHIPLMGFDRSKQNLLSKLRDIHRWGWINSERLFRDGQIGPCVGSNCGGYTLEAHLGIVPNGRAEPDYDGWEIKGHTVNDFTRYSGGPLTLMTPEPTGGFYKEEGPEAFVRKYGYPDRQGRPDRLNFGGVHVCGVTHARTGLTLQFLGYDQDRNRITDPSGGFTLADADGNEAATWHFAGLIGHWNRKHAKAAYIPFQLRKLPIQQYIYGPRVRLAEETDFLRFLRGMSEGKVYYDPGIKLEGASTARPAVKRRSQFRIKSADIGALYARVETASLAD